MNNSWYAAAETNQFEPMHWRNQTRFPVNWLRTPTVRLNLRGPRTAPLTQCVGSYPSHETCGMVSLARRMRAQHQTTMTIHVRKLNRGMNNNQSINFACWLSQSINKQSLNQQAKQQKPPPPGRNFKKNSKAGPPGAEFQKEFKKFKFKLNLNETN